MEIIAYIIIFISGFLLGKHKRTSDNYDLYKKTNGLFEPVKRS